MSTLLAKRKPAFAKKKLTFADFAKRKSALAKRKPFATCYLDSMLNLAATWSHIITFKGKLAVCKKPNSVNITIFIEVEMIIVVLLICEFLACCIHLSSAFQCFMFK